MELDLERKEEEKKKIHEERTKTSRKVTKKMKTQITFYRYRTNMEVYILMSIACIKTAKIVSINAFN